MNDELIKRLRAASAAMRSHYAVGAVELIPTWTMDGAANEIERLTAEVRRLDHSTTHTCWDECPRLACAQRREIDALTAQLAEAQQQASKLWALLDDIDTLDDSCRGDDDLFRTLTRAAQLTRHAIMTGEEWDAARADPVRDTLADSDGDDGA